MSIIYKNGTYYGGGGAGAEITIDSELSSTSENPIQNKVIKTELDNKVDKVTGKGLSSNDYTNEEKNKLNEISSDTGVISGSYGPESKAVLYDNTVFPVSEIVVNSKGKITSIKDREITAINNHSYYLNTDTPGSTAMKVLTVRDEKRGNVENTVNDFQGMIIGVLTTSEDNTANNVELSFDGVNSFSIKYNGAVYTGNDPKITGWKNHYIYYMFDGYDFVYMGNDSNESNIDDMPAEDMAEVASPMPSVMSRRFKYSMEEQIVGEWIDGKPIYQKVFDLSNELLPTNSNEKEIPVSGLSVIGIDNVIKQVALIKGVTGSFWENVFLTTDNGGRSYCAVDVGGNKCLIRQNQTGDANQFKAVALILQYTKTTD